MGVRRVVWRVCYEALAARVRTPQWSFMNYGYVPSEPGQSRPALDPEDEPDRLSIQLYEHAVAGTDLRGADVLEVGCGRGGGASYLSRYHRPASMTGLDFSHAAVALCRRTRSAPGLSFVHGDALAMPLPAEAFDAVVNVESSHCYDSMATFLREVHRVLRPGGSLLWADIRDRQRAEELRRDFAESPLTVRSETDITGEVLRALQIDDKRRQALVDAWIPWGFRRAMRQWAGTSGTTNFTRLENGEMRYLSARLVKEA
jgi:SAM-dependent methyltransferase